MTVKDLYRNLCKYFPEEKRLEWDNDGIMVSTDSFSEVTDVLVTLDVTEEIVDYAIERGFNLIISHHPLIFRPIGSVTEECHVSRKVIKLISNNISVFSFHTRADIAAGGVNDILARRLGLSDVVPFGADMLGRVGSLESECELDVFVDNVKSALGADVVRVSDGYNTVRRVAVVGGDGKDLLKEAIRAEADTFVSGRLSYNVMEEASELGINLIEAGHYFTEQPITELFAELVAKIDPNSYVEIANSNMIKSY